jgi:hypothetical protein
VAVEVRVEDEAELPLAVQRADPVQIDLADDTSRLLKHDGQRRDVPLLREPMAPSALHEQLADLVAVAHPPVEIAHHLGQRVVGGDVVEVAVGERAQQQALGPERLIDLQHPAILSCQASPLGQVL